MSVSADQQAEAASTKITICHRTHSTTNPYRRITVSQNAVQNARHGGHEIPTGSANPAVFDAGFSYAPNNKYWGDVIPGATNGGLTYNGSAQVALNWTTAGQALFFSSACKGMTASEFYDSEVAAGVPTADIIADLNDQLANEDVALLAALGGSFTVGNVAQWASAISVVTNAATSVTSSGATLNGTLTVGSTSTVTSFDWGLDPTMATYTTVLAAPSPVTGTTSVAAAVSGLSPGTTYFYRVVGVTNIGTDSEGVLNGDVLSFRSADVAPTTTASDPSTTTTIMIDPSTSTTVDPSTTTTFVPSTTTTVDPSTTTTFVSSTTTTVDPSTTTSTFVPSSTSTLAPTSTTGDPSTTSTTTIASSTTATIVPSPTITTDRATGAITGRVWIDSNNNDQFDAGEISVDGVLFTLRAMTGVDLVDGTDPGGNPSPTVLIHTGSDGSFRLEGLDPGRYAITASMTLGGFRYTYDSDGGGDWLIDVEVVAGGTARADAAGVAAGALAVTAVDRSSGVPMADARVSCSWAGLDDIFATMDDRVIESLADGSGVAFFPSVPAGEYQCRSTNSMGTVSGAIFASVGVAEPTEVRLPVAGPSTVTLPSTGGDLGGSLRFAGLCALVGMGLLLITRRPTTR